MSDPVIVARIARAHGLGGGLILDAETDHAEALFHTGRRLQIIGGRPDVPPSLTLVSARPHSGRWLVVVEEVGDRGAADLLRGTAVAVSREELPDLDDGDYLLNDLIGLRVLERGETLGEIVDVLDMPAGPMLSVRVDGRDRLIPFDGAMVDSVDIAAGEVHVSLPPGLLDV